MGKDFKELNPGDVPNALPSDLEMEPVKNRKFRVRILMNLSPTAAYIVLGKDEFEKLFGPLDSINEEPGILDQMIDYNTSTNTLNQAKRFEEAGFGGMPEEAAEGWKIVNGKARQWLIEHGIKVPEQGFTLDEIGREAEKQHAPFREKAIDKILRNLDEIDD